MKCCLLRANNRHQVLGFCWVVTYSRVAFLYSSFFFVLCRSFLESCKWCRAACSSTSYNKENLELQPKKGLRKGQFWNKWNLLQPLEMNFMIALENLPVWNNRSCIKTREVFTCKKKEKKSLLDQFILNRVLCGHRQKPHSVWSSRFCFLTWNWLQQKLSS